MAEIAKAYEVKKCPKILNKSIKFVNKFCFTIYSWNNPFFAFQMIFSIIVHSEE